jgi:precorrin-3B C17-methyltransferase
MTIKAKSEIERADVVVGYLKYVDLVRSLIRPTAEVIANEMGKEVERAELAIKRALDGKQVVVVSSGDPGVYGMAGVVLEVAERMRAKVPIEIVPGVTAATAAAAIVGAPIMGDFAVISLSDLLMPWDEIEKRLKVAATADFVIVLYNPQSKNRREPLLKAYKILLEYRDPSTPVGIVRNAGRKGEQKIITRLKDMLNHEIDMVTTIIVGNSKTRIVDGWIVTSRGYKIL